jgi:hypothetical protein
VILRWKQGSYRVANDLMFKPAPTEEQFTAAVAEVRQSDQWAERDNRDSIPTEIFDNALELMFSGHEEYGWRFLREAWKPGIPFDEKLMDEFRSKLAESRYWNEIALRVQKANTPLLVPANSDESH